MIALFEFMVAMLVVAVVAEVFLTTAQAILVVVVAALVCAGVRGLWQHGEARLRAVLAAAGGRCCQACAVMADDDLMDVADDVFADGARPVNEPRAGWDRLDGRNRGAWLDHVSRTANAQNARWITERQIDPVGKRMVSDLEKWLESGREPGSETTGEIRRGDPGE